MQRLRQMPRIISYQDCVDFYATARRWRQPALYGQGHIGEPKKIDAAGKAYKSVRQVRVERPELGEVIAYAWRYHDTDVVTWLTEDLIEVTPWASLSTTSFMEALLPPRLVVNMHHPIGCLIGVRASLAPEYPTIPYGEPGHDEAYEAYRVAFRAWDSSTTWFRVPAHEPVLLSRVGDTWSVSPTLPIEVPMVNAKKAHAARREFNTAGLGAWLDAMFAMNPWTAVRDAQAHALARASDPAQALAEDMRPNSDLGLQFMQEAMRNPELWWAMLASPHLRPPRRYTRGGLVSSRTHHEEVRDWRNHLKRCALLAAYHAHGAVEVWSRPHVTSLESATTAHRLGVKWGLDYHTWPELE